MATSGACASSCNLVFLFIVLLFLGMLCTLTTVTPVSMAILRYVSLHYMYMDPPSLFNIVIYIVSIIPIVVVYQMNTGHLLWGCNG